MVQTPSEPHVVNRIIQAIKLRHRSGVRVCNDTTGNRSMANTIGATVKWKQKPMKTCQWKAPIQGAVSLNTDGSLMEGKAGFGGIIRNSNGNVLLAYCGGTKEITITAIEMQAIEEGLKLARQMGLNNIEVGSDSKIAVECIEGRCKPAWRTQRYYNRIAQMKNFFDRLHTEHIYRETNRCADFVANLCTSEEPLFCFYGPLPKQLMQFVNQDAMGIVYIRV